MSIQIMSVVFNTALPPYAKTILLALGDCADDGGYCYPSLRTIEHKASLKKTALTNHLKTQESLKIITRTQRNVDGTSIVENKNKRKTTTAYIIHTKELEKYIVTYRKTSNSSFDKKTSKELKEIDFKVNQIQEKYAKRLKSFSHRKKKKPQCGQPKIDEKPQCGQSKKINCADNLNHQSNLIDDDELEKYFDDFYLYLNSIGIISTSNIEMHKITIRINLKDGDKFSIENWKKFMKLKNQNNSS